MSRVSAGWSSVDHGDLDARSPRLSERGRIATPMPRATSRRIRLLSLDSSITCGSNFGLAGGAVEQLAQTRALAVADELLAGELAHAHARSLAPAGALAAGSRRAPRTRAGAARGRGSRSARSPTGTRGRARRRAASRRAPRSTARSTVSSTPGWRWWKIASASDTSTGPIVCIAPTDTWPVRMPRSASQLGVGGARTRTGSAAPARPAAPRPR